MTIHAKQTISNIEWVYEFSKSDINRKRTHFTQQYYTLWPCTHNSYPMFPPDGWTVMFIMWIFFSRTNVFIIGPATNLHHINNHVGSLKSDILSQFDIWISFYFAYAHNHHFRASVHKADWRLTERSREASKLRDSGLYFSNSSKKFKAPRQQCWHAGQITERHDHYNIQSRGLETSSVREITKSSSTFFCYKHY